MFIKIKFICQLPHDINNNLNNLYKNSSIVNENFQVLSLIHKYLDILEKLEKKYSKLDNTKE
jgi:hypothetical protein